MNYLFLYTVILILEFFNGINTVEIQRKSSDIFPGKFIDCVVADSFVEVEGLLCKCSFGKPHFVSVEGKAPYCRGTKDIKDYLKCSFAPLYIGKNGQSSNVSQDISTEKGTCGQFFVKAEYWDYDDVTKTGSWKTSDVLTQLTVKQTQTEVLKIKFDDRNWNGMLIKLIKKQPWCTTCKIVKFEGTLNYPIRQANFLPITTQTANNIRETTKDSANLMIGVAAGVAATISLLVIFLAVCFIYRRKKKKKQNNQETVATIPVGKPSTLPSYATISTKQNLYTPISPYKGRSEIYMGLNQFTVEIHSTAQNVDSTAMIDATKIKVDIPHYEVNIPHYEVDDTDYEVCDTADYEVNVPHYEVNVPHCEVNVPHYEVDEINSDDYYNSYIHQ